MITSTIDCFSFALGLVLDLIYALSVPTNCFYRGLWSAPLCPLTPQLLISWGPKATSQMAAASLRGR